MSIQAMPPPIHDPKVESPACPQPLPESGVALPGDRELPGTDLGFRLLAGLEVRGHFARQFMRAGDVTLDERVDLSRPREGRFGLGKFSRKPALQNSRPGKRSEEP